MGSEETTDGGLREVKASIDELSRGIADLRDLFVRRLYDDRQKDALIGDLEGKANFAYIEPFLSDVILLLDRMEKVDDDFVRTVYDELFDIVQRRGVERIVVTRQFDPGLNRAVRVVEGDSGAGTVVAGVVRNGYMFDGRVIRPAEVIVERGKPKTSEEV